MTNNNDVTINELMDFLQEHMATKEDLFVFEQKVDKHFFQIDGRLDQIDGRLDQIDGRLDHMNARLDSIDCELEDIKNRLTRLEQKVQEEGNMYAQEVVDLRQRVNILEKQVRAMQAV